MRAVWAVVGGRFDDPFVSLGIVVDVFLAKRGDVEKTVEQVRTPVEQAGVLPDVVTARTECRKRSALKERGRANHGLLGCVVAAPVTGPSFITKSVIRKELVRIVAIGFTYWAYFDSSHLDRHNGREHSLCSHSQ